MNSQRRGLQTPQSMRDTTEGGNAPASDRETAQARVRASLIECSAACDRIVARELARQRRAARATQRQGD